MPITVRYLAEAAFRGRWLGLISGSKLYFDVSDACALKKNMNALVREINR